MDSVKESLAALAEVFNTSMDSFQRDLKKTSPTSNTTSNLSVEFSAFRNFIVSALNTLQQQVLFLGRAVDIQEMQRRRKTLLFHGVAEDRTQADQDKIAQLTIKQLEVQDFNKTLITKCYRLGKLSNKKPRPIVVKFKNIELRDKIWYSKTKLKGSGVTQSEFLTKARHDVFLLARQRFGVGKCWTKHGNIFILMPDGTRQKVECIADIDKLSKETSATNLATAESRLPHSKPTTSTESKPEVLRAKRVTKK